MDQLAGSSYFLAHAILRFDHVLPMATGYTALKILLARDDQHSIVVKKNPILFYRSSVFQLERILSKFLLLLLLCGQSSTNAELAKNFIFVRFKVVVRIDYF